MIRSRIWCYDCFEIRSDSVNIAYSNLRRMILRSLHMILVLLLLAGPLDADEGMWLLPLIEDLNMNRMEEMGLTLTAEDIYSINNSSLKDVVGALDYGSCTAELISAEGLILTNHHCVEDEIQNYTTPARDYLRDGFWAAESKDELPNPGKTISFIVRMENVSEQILGLVHDEMTERERDESIGIQSRKIIDQAVEGTHYEANVLSFFGGNEYYLVLMETFRDIRLVGAPPESIGRFGFDRDNWEWPRHNADFSLMRIYTGPDGKPAEYSMENIPYRPSRSLAISLGGYEENDFAFILGFPGTTHRFSTSDRIREIRDIENSNRIKIRDRALGLIMEEMLINDRIRIQYSTKYSNLSNYYKYSRGQNISIRNLKIIERKQAQEEKLRHWIAQDSSRIERYGGMLTGISKTIEERKEMENALSFLEEMFLLHKATEMIGFAGEARSLYFYELGYTSDENRKKEIVAELKASGDKFFKDFNPGLDKRIAMDLIGLYSVEVDPLYYPYFYSTLMSEFDGEVDDYLDHVYSKSVFADSLRFRKFIAKPRFRKLKKDPGFLLAFSLLSKYVNILYEYEELDEKLVREERRYIMALREMYPDSTFYPDANSTLRLTYGSIKGYRGQDAVYYDHRTTLSGVFEKEDPGSREYSVPGRLRELYNTRDYNPWIKSDTMPVCFLTDNDITGGNSGSPVLNERGELIGLAFDGNWESMSGDIIYEKGKQRTICVDIRYILFLIDHYARADHLIGEMNILPNE